MKVTECKIKQIMTFEEMPGYLRHLADALEKITDSLPSELAHLPEPITKMAIKGKARENGWELKIEIKAASSPGPALAATAVAQVPEALSIGKAPVEYKSIKKRMKSTFKAIGESLAARRLPEPDIAEAFLSDSELMLSFPGEKFGEPCYPAYRKACRRLSEAYATKNREAFNEAFTTLGQLKKNCHNEYK